MAIDMNLVKQLRERSSVGFADCKSALEESKGDIEKAYEILRKKGIAKLSKRSDKTSEHGWIGTYLHNGQLLGLAIVMSETDFVSQGKDFQEFAKELAMQVASQNPTYIKIEDVPADVLAKEKGELKAIIIATGSEVSLAMEAYAQLEGVRVVSMPCAEEFVKQDAAYREAVLPASIRARVAVEAAHVDYWWKFVGLDGKVIGMTTYGESAPAKDLFEFFGITTDAVVAAVKELTA